MLSQILYTITNYSRLCFQARVWHTLLHTILDSFCSWIVFLQFLASVVTSLLTIPLEKLLWDLTSTYSSSHILDSLSSSQFSTFSSLGLVSIPSIPAYHQLSALIRSPFLLISHTSIINSPESAVFSLKSEISCRFLYINQRSVQLSSLLIVGFLHNLRFGLDQHC